MGGIWASGNSELLLVEIHSTPHVPTCPLQLTLRSETDNHITCFRTGNYLLCPIGERDFYLLSPDLKKRTRGDWMSGMVYGVEKIKHIIDFIFECVDRNAVVVKLTGAMVVENEKHSM